MNATIRKKLARRKRRIQKRLDKRNLRGGSQPMLTARNIQYEIGERSRGIGYGGIGAIHLLVRKLGLAEAIDRRLRLLQIHLPYHESDHVLNLAYNGACKQGMDIAYNGTWGYHPLVVSLANTGEVLSLVNRSGNRPSHEGAAAEIDRAIRVCREGGFRQILVRGDTDFTQTKHLDRWDDDGVQFIFGADETANLHILADDLPAGAWQTLSRPPRYEVQTQPRQRPENVKEPIVVERGFKNIRLVSETVAEFDYRPTACRKSYRLIVVRKNLSVEKGEQVLFDDYRYFCYLSNARTSTPAEMVLHANDRCNQETCTRN